MPWLRVNGMAVHVKMAKRPRKRCVGTEGGHACPTPATHQCDYHLASGKTCDAWICSAHATSVGLDVDHCPTHAHAQAGLFTQLIDGACR